MRRLLNGVRVLLLDDDADTRLALAAGLREEGAEVHDADSAQTALLLVETHRPDALVVDLELPEVDGYGFLRAVRRLRPESGGHAPAVALTTRMEPGERRRALLAGFRLYLGKPLRARDLADKLASLLVLFGSGAVSK